MAVIPHLNSDVYFGDTETPLPDWRDNSALTTDEDDTMTDEERKSVWGMIGFDPPEDDDEDDSGWEGLPPSRFQSSKSLTSWLRKDHKVGTCKPGQNPKRDQCTPATDTAAQKTPGSQQPAKPVSKGKQKQGAAQAKQKKTPKPSKQEAVEKAFTDFEADLPIEVKENPGMMKKVKHTFNKLNSSIGHIAIQTAFKLSHLAPHILEKASDISHQLMGAGDAFGHIRDPIEHHTGVPSHIAMKIASHLLGRASVWIGKKIALGKSMDDGMSIEDQADAILEVLQQTYKSIGVDKLGMTREQVIKYLKQNPGQSEKQTKEKLGGPEQPTSRFQARRKKRLEIRRKNIGTYFTKDKGQPCKPGETAKNDGCTPAKDDGASTPASVQSSNDSPKASSSSSSESKPSRIEKMQKLADSIRSPKAQKVAKNIAKKTLEGSITGLTDLIKSKPTPKAELHQVSKDLEDKLPWGTPAEEKASTNVSDAFKKMATEADKKITSKTAGGLLNWMKRLPMKVLKSVATGLGNYAKETFKSAGKVVAGVGIHLAGIALGLGVAASTLAIPLAGPGAAPLAILMLHAMALIPATAIGAAITSKVSKIGQRVAYQGPRKQDYEDFDPDAMTSKSLYYRGFRVEGVQ